MSSRRDPTRLELTGVSKTYTRRGVAYGTLRDALFGSGRAGARPERVAALDDINLRVEPGEVLGIVGPNGAGKSTLLKILARVVAPDAGRVVVRGRLSALIEVGGGFHPELSASENVLLHGSMLGLRRRDLRRDLPRILAFAGVEADAATPVKFFSTGMYARLGFSVAVHADPRVLLVDEVLAVGDEAFKAQCEARIQALTRDGTAILFVTHDGATLQRMTHRAVRLTRGRIVDEGSPADVWMRHEQASV